jgi:hypothetical protein
MAENVRVHRDSVIFVISHVGCCVVIEVTQLQTTHLWQEGKGRVSNVVAGYDEKE